tara:strand:- start:24557 stop:24733 length:177 start_codon:yes stop_codon:yes gene_type:complete
MKTLKVTYICDLRISKCELPTGVVKWFLFDEGDGGRLLVCGTREQVSARVSAEMAAAQ